MTQTQVVQWDESGDIMTILTREYHIWRHKSIYLLKGGWPFFPLAGH